MIDLNLLNEVFEELADNALIEIDQALPLSPADLRAAGGSACGFAFD